jgi:CheY-like chemotaxis protein
MQTPDQDVLRFATKILVAEENAALRMDHASALRSAGHTVWEAADGGEALSLVQSHQPEVLLIDLWMPVLNALEVVELLRNRAEAVGLKVVVLSESEESDPRLESFALGVADYWIKPFSPDELCREICNLLHKDATAPWRAG